MILVTAATGAVGGALVARLSTDGVPVRALVRSRERADDLRGFDCEIAVGDFADEASLRAALDGVDRVFLADRTGPGLAEEELALVRSCAPGTRVVLLAWAGLDGAGGGRILDAHREVAAGLRESGLPATVLAPGPFLQDLVECASAVQERGELPVWTGAAPAPWVDARDVAAVAAHVLGSDGHEGATYTVTGPELLDGEALAAAVGSALGRDVRWAEPPAPSDWVGEGRAEIAAWLGGAVLQPTDEVRRATGRDARGVTEFLGEHRAAFRSRDA